MIANVLVQVQCRLLELTPEVLTFGVEDFATQFIIAAGSREVRHGYGAGRNVRPRKPRADEGELSFAIVSHVRNREKKV
jgi:hypothetical protein